MKRILFFFSLSVFSQSIKAQTTSVGIGTASPNASAMLDVTSPLNNKGVLLPRMTTAQRIAIPSPATGLMVYETTTSSLWVFNGVVWVQQSSGGVSPWTLSSTNIFNSNSGNVGIGITAPTTKLHIGGDVLLQNGSIKIDDSNPAMSLISDGLTRGFIKLQSSTGDMSIGTQTLYNPDGKLLFQIQNQPKLAIAADGNVGIGTIIPGYKLDVRGNVFAGGNVTVDGDIAADGNLRLDDGYIRINNTINTKNWQLSNSSALGGRLLFLQQGLERVVFQNDGNVGIGGNLPLSNNGFPETKLHIESGQDAGLTSSTNGYLMLGPGNGTNIVIDNNEIVARNNGGTASLILQNDGGTVRIGNTAVPSGYKFAINGKMICEELKVKLASTGWPDYVFDKKYRLTSLTEVEKFILQNKHLPNIPSAAEVEKNGIEIGDMQKRMMEKIEELTLYIIELKKDIELLKLNK